MKALSTSPLQGPSNCGPDRGPRRCRKAMEAKASLAHACKHWLCWATEAGTKSGVLPQVRQPNPCCHPPKAPLITGHEETIGSRGIGTLPVGITGLCRLCSADFVVIVVLPR